MCLYMFASMFLLQAGIMTTSKQADILSFCGNFEVPVGNESFVPNLPSNIGRLAKGKHFSIFKKEHAEEAATVYNYLIECDSFEFVGNAGRLRKILNEGIYVYAVGVACLHRTETTGHKLASPFNMTTTRYFPYPVILNAKKAARINDDTSTNNHCTVPIFTTGTNRDTEFKMAWWREDVELNSHHYQWHQVYPWKGINGTTKDREGELFYYMHQQMLARYDTDRLGVGLFRVDPYVNWNRPIPEGYNSHLTDYYGTYQFAPRPSNMYLADSWSDPNNPSLVNQQKYHYDRLLDAINTGQFITKNQTMENVTIDRLGAAVEASISSPNSALYGSLHNTGHDLLASVMDPDGRYQMAGGVMGDTATAIRDPIFFRWHKFLDNLFVLHKLTLVPYTQGDLELKDLTIKSVQVQVKLSDEQNVLTTHMEHVVYDIAQDLFLEKNEKNKTKPHTPINVSVRQVNHDNFDYHINIDSTRAMKAAIRIFIAPTFDDNGIQYKLTEQRRLYIEMDKFVYFITRGENNITRSSTTSSVSKPTEMSLDGNSLETRYGTCGWPHHMLLPRGTGSGMKFDLFVMATEREADSLTDNLDTGTSYCGVKNDKYPDSRSMGFPFDRKITIYDTIDDFVDAFSNMYTTPIWITYKESRDVPSAN